MAKVLAPCFELFGCLAHDLAKLYQSLSNAMRVEVGVLYGFAGPDEATANALGIGPFAERSTGEFRTIVHADQAGAFLALFTRSSSRATRTPVIEGIDDVARAFSGEVIDARKAAEAPPVG